MSDDPDSLSSAKNEALKWVAEGMKLEEAAARVGVGVLTVKRWARENDIPTSQADIFRILQEGDVGGPAGKWTIEKGKMMLAWDVKLKKLQTEYEAETLSSEIQLSIKKNSESGLYEVLDQDGVVLGGYERRKIARGQVTRLNNKALYQREQPLRKLAIQLLRQGAKRAHVAKKLGVRLSTTKKWQDELLADSIPIKVVRDKKSGFYQIIKPNGGLLGEYKRRSHARAQATRHSKAYAKQMLSEGINVGEVTKRTGVSKTTIIKWRKEVGIPSAVEKSFLHRKEVKDEAIQMLSEGISRGEVGRRLGVNKGIVSGWANSEGILSRNEVSSEIKEEALQMIRDGVSSAEVRRRLGVGRTTLVNWRKSSGLSRGPGNSKAHLKDEALQMIREGISGREVSRRLGVSITSVSKWRKAAGLSGKSPQNSYDTEKENDVIDLLREGKSHNHIRRVTRVGLATIKKWEEQAKREEFL